MSQISQEFKNFFEEIKKGIRQNKIYSKNRYLTTKDKNQMSLKSSIVKFKSNEGLKLSNSKGSIFFMLRI
jgi:hypothetical protein